MITTNGPDGTKHRSVALMTGRGDSMVNLTLPLGEWVTATLQAAARVAEHSVRVAVLVDGVEFNAVELLERLARQGMAS